MSHFSVLVIGDDVEKQLQPYHEYECTGIDDEYVIDVDVTEEFEKYLESETEAVRLPCGSVKSRYSYQFYIRESDEEFYRKLGQRQFELPAGAEIITVTERELAVLEGRTEEETAESYGGYIKKGGGYYRHTNPNKKWDWWTIGGRWTGALKLKPKCLGIVGRPGLMTEPAPAGYADQARKGDVDFEQMRNDASVRARALWKETRSITRVSWDSWDDMCIRYPVVEEARTEYWDQPALILLKASGKREYNFKVDDDLALEEEVYVARQRDAACVNYAFVRDGQWTERGKMGWWGMASDEVSKLQWNRMFNDMLDAIPAETLLTIVDCHI